MATQKLYPNTILITGATSGIGAALALGYAATGMNLALSGRNESRLKKIANQCRDRGAEVEAQIVDVADRAEMARWVANYDEKHPIDLIIANAGVTNDTTNDSNADEEETIRDIFAVNLAGTLNTVLPIIPRMRSRQKGQIALMSSLAGFRGLPSSPAYSASKAAVRSYGEALHGRLYDDGITVSVICPGFVKSRITDQNDFHMPFFMEADKAAAIIKRGLERRKAMIAFPRIMFLMTWLMTTLPRAITDPLTRRLPRKE